jgi:hypothetical protein
MIRVAERDWITATEAPAYLGPDVQAQTVRAWAARGKVAGHRIGRETYYRLDDLTEIEHATRTSNRGHRRTVVMQALVM